MALLQDSQPDLCLLAKSGGCSVYQLRNESGEGTMTVYEVFPGATILYNDFHMAYCDSSFETLHRLLPGGPDGIRCGQRCVLLCGGR